MPWSALATERLVMSLPQGMYVRVITTLATDGAWSMPLRRYTCLARHALASPFLRLRRDCRMASPQPRWRCMRMRRWGLPIARRYRRQRGARERSLRRLGGGCGGGRHMRGGRSSRFESLGRRERRGRKVGSGGW